MGVIQKFLSMDKYFKSTQGEKIIINDLNYFSLEHANIINQAIMTIYQNTDVMSTIPTCDCGKLRGRYNKGLVCEYCGTMCSEIQDKTEPILWLRTLRDDLPFINPGFWLVLRNIMESKQVDWLRWLSDRSYNPAGVSVKPYVLNIKEMIGERSYKSVIANIPAIIDYLKDDPKFKDEDKQLALSQLKEIYLRDNKNMFSTYLPIINKRMFVMENTNKGRFVNFTSSDIIDITKAWIKSSNDAKVHPYDPNKYDKAAAATGTIVSKLADLAKAYIDKYLVKKDGIFRKHVYGARSHFTFRCVIVSRAGRHMLDELELPWCIGPTAFRPHLMNKLVKRGYTYKQASRMLFDAVNRYDPLIYELMNELITDCDEKGIPIMVLRNPSLFQSSTLLLYATTFKSDPADKTMAISQLVCDTMNADFDGDVSSYRKCS